MEDDKPSIWTLAGVAVGKQSGSGAMEIWFKWGNNEQLMPMCCNIETLDKSVVAMHIIYKKKSLLVFML